MKQASLRVGLGSICVLMVCGSSLGIIRRHDVADSAYLARAQESR